MVLFKSNFRDIISISNEFTFHYGPIQIVSAIDIQTHKSFTFHYGPIQILAHQKPLLFIAIYIPLWSYSNSIYINRMCKRDIFTFHYGPIQIREPNPCYSNSL